MTLHRIAKWASIPAGLWVLLLTGCALPNQPKEEVLVREPGNRRYSPPAPASGTADRIWPYAVLSANVYRGVWREGPAVVAVPTLSEVEGTTTDAADPYVRACVEKPSGFLPLDG